MMELDFFHLNLTVLFKPCLRFTYNKQHVCISGRMQSYGPRLRKWKYKSSWISNQIENFTFELHVFLVLLSFILCTVKRVRNVHGMLSIIFL